MRLRFWWRTAIVLVCLGFGASGAEAETPLAYCLSHAVVGFTAGERVSMLGDTRAGDHTLTLRNALSENLHGYGATTVAIKARPVPLGSLEGLARPLDEADQHHAAMLVVLELDAKEYRLSNPYIGGDQFPLRTVQLLLHIWVIAGGTRDVWSDFTIDRTIAANSIDEAVSRFSSEELANPLAKALRDGCDELQKLPAVQPAPPSIMEANQTAPAHVTPQAKPLPVMAKRTALIIGDSDYSAFRKLPNAGRDAKSMADTLRTVGFEIVATKSFAVGDHAEFADLVRTFVDKSRNSDVVAVYFAGHGATVSENNYIFLEKAQTPRDDLARVSLDELTDAVLLTGAKLKLIILDACRDRVDRGLMPDDNSRSIGSGFTAGPPDQARAAGVAIFFATAKGSTSGDGNPGGNGPFVSALVPQMLVRGKHILDVFNDTALAVRQGTHGAQNPWVSFTSIASEFTFVSR